MANRGDFVHLHLHSQYSILDGAIKIKDLVKKAKEYGMPAVAVTDHGNMHASYELYKECTAEGIKPIIGQEFYIAKVQGLISKKAMKEKKEVTIWFFWRKMKQVSKTL